MHDVGIVVDEVPSTLGGSLLACNTDSWNSQSGGSRVGSRKHSDTYSVTGLADRLAPYEAVELHVDADDAVDPELLERAARLLAIMPGNQRRETIESLLSPNDLDRGRRAVDRLIETAFAVEDHRGHLRVT